MSAMAQKDNVINVNSWIINLLKFFTYISLGVVSLFLVSIITLQIYERNNFTILASRNLEHEEGNKIVFELKKEQIIGYTIGLDFFNSNKFFLHYYKNRIDRMGSKRFMKTADLLLPIRVWWKIKCDGKTNIKDGTLTSEYSMKDRRMRMPLFTLDRKYKDCSAQIILEGDLKTLSGNVKVFKKRSMYGHNDSQFEKKILEIKEFLLWTLGTIIIIYAMILVTVFVGLPVLSILIIIYLQNRR